MPKEDADIDPKKYSDERAELGGFKGMPQHFDIKCRINHNPESEKGAGKKGASGEINRARHCP